MRIQWKKLIPCLLLPLLVGGLAGLISHNGMEAFEALQKPPLTPPGWVFPAAWTVLYLIMGFACYLVMMQSPNHTALRVYGVQLAVNFLWPILFFSLGMFLPAFVLLIVLWLLIFLTILLFWQVSRTAALLLIPYILWVTFAGYLNFGIYLLNR